ncbi:MAG: ribokinase [Acidobacteria bacterium]|nr:ribokinase [Acidobacteriota bacterium]MBI3428395.1 ribokinase [Acidobacteriota bacterium]
MERIVVVGSSNTDMIIKMQRIPKPGETIIGGDFLMAAGGKGANQAVAAARSGGQVAFIARVGNDLFGEQATKGFADDGINVDYIIKDADAPSGVALIFVGSDGENSIGVASGANAKLSVEDIERTRAVISSAGVLLIQLETPIETVKAAVRLAAHGATVILNPAPAQPLDDEILRYVSILTPNESEAELLTGVTIENEAGAATAATALRARGVETVLITLGAQGVFVASDDFCGIVPGFNVTPVDTTAAGDVFNGALAVALAEKKPLREAVRFANAAAALSVTKLGAQPSAPYRQEIEAFLSTR